MAVIVAPWLGLLLGLIFAWSARESLANSEKGPFSTEAVLLISAFGLLVFGPATGYFLAYAPDWSFAYLIDSQRLPAIAEMVALLVTAASPLLGFAIFARPASRREGGAMIRSASVLALLIAAMTVSLGRRFSTDANYTQFQGAFGTTSVAGSRLGWSLLWMNSVVALSTGWLIRQLRRLT